MIEIFPIQTFFTNRICQYIHFHVNLKNSGIPVKLSELSNLNNTISIFDGDWSRRYRFCKIKW